MDVAKYIGLFLLKNNFVYIHGLGNLELRKRPASFNGEALRGSTYEVVMTPMGSIDDNLANFIATNEQISISKASNALREFSQQARLDLQAGRTVPLPSIGVFAEENGKTTFVTDPNFQYTPPAIPTMKVARRQDETVYTTNADIPAVKPRYIDPDTEVEERGISWVKITAWGVGLIMVAALIYLGVRYLSIPGNTGDNATLPAAADTIQMQTPPVDSTELLAVDTSTSNILNEGGLLSFDVILNTYTDLTKAQRRTDKLKSYGNEVELITEDSAVFYVILPVSQVAPADTASLLDSLKRVFNPTYGVKILE